MTSANCKHWRCRLYRAFSLLETAGMIRATNRWPIPCQKEQRRMYRTVYRRQRDLNRFPDIDPARLPLTVYSSSDNLDYQREDLTYLRTDKESDTAQAWIETRIEQPWERTDD